MILELDKHYKKIKDKKYKYEVLEDYIYPLNGFQQFENKYIKLTYDSILIRKGYWWDGASGGFPDVPSIMRGSLVHDAMYQVIRDSNFKKSEKKALQAFADLRLKDICIEDGMSKPMAHSVYLGVRLAGNVVGKL